MHSYTFHHVNVIITHDILAPIITNIDRVNDVRLQYLEDEKTPYLFSSSQLAEILDITPSVKTRLSMIQIIGPRLTDPRSKVDHFLGLFRFSEEKEKVQEVLKARTHVLSSNLFKQRGLQVLHSEPSGSPMSANSDTPAVKPFVGIKGLAGARERVSKPILKSRTLELLTTDNIAITPSSSAPVSPITIASTNQSESSWHGVSSTPPKPPVLIPVTIRPPVPQIQLPSVFTPYSKRSSIIVEEKVPCAASKSTRENDPSEFASSGAVQRMIKTYSSCKISSETSDVPQRNQAGSSTNTLLKTITLAPARPDRPLSVTRGTFELPVGTFVPIELGDGNEKGKLSSTCSLLGDEDNLNSECTSVESEGLRSEDSVNTWRLAKNKLNVSSVARGMNRLSIAKEKEDFSTLCGHPASPGEQSECTTIESSLKSESGEVGGNCDDPFQDGMGKQSNRSSRSARKRFSKSEKSRSPVQEVRRESARRMRRDSLRGIASSVPVSGNGNLKDLTLYNTMPVEGPVGQDTEGTLLYRYYELVRMNFVKKYEGVNQSELVFAMVEDDFRDQFGMSKVTDSSFSFFLFFSLSLSLSPSPSRTHTLTLSITLLFSLLSFHSDSHLFLFFIRMNFELNLCGGKFRKRNLSYFFDQFCRLTAREKSLFPLCFS